MYVLFVTVKYARYLYSSSSSASSLTTLKNLNSYTPWEVETTRSQSRSCCFLRYFFVLGSKNLLARSKMHGSTDGALCVWYALTGT